MSTVEEILAAEERSMGRPVTLLTTALLGDALCVLYLTESQPLPPGDHVLVQRRLAVWAPDSKTSIIVSSEWKP